MAENTLTLPYSTTEDVQDAARFIAALIPSGVVFYAMVSNGRMVITFTGGH